MVFGRRSAVAAAEYAKNADRFSSDESMLQSEQARDQALLDRPADLRASTVRRDMGESMVAGIGVYRDQDSIDAATAKIKELRGVYPRVAVDNKGKVFNTDLMSAIELDYMLDVAQAVCAGADARKESRGAHFRTDMPDRDDENWLKHTLVYKDGEGSRVETSDVTITDWTPIERVY